MSDYLDNVRKYAPGASEDTVNKLVKHLGIALRNRDSSLVSCSDEAELNRVRDGFCKKKLGLSREEAEAAIKAVCEQMKEERAKSRVTFYYLVAEKVGKLSAIS